jgi:hypothetical protein
LARVPGAEPVYEAAKLFQMRCLVDGTSLLWPGRQAWTLPNMDALWEAFVGHPDEGPRTFFEKWHDQLADQAKDVHRVAVDLLAFYYLFPLNVKPQKKLEAVEEVIGWKLQERPPDFALLERAYAAKLGHAGIQYAIALPWQLNLYIELAQRVRSESIPPTDHEAYKRIADELKEKIGRCGAGRNILLHLFFPERFEYIASGDHKRKIIRAFWDRTEGVDDEDEALLNIRRSLVNDFSREDLDFYDPDIEPLWRNPERIGQKKEKSVKTGTRFWVEKTLVRGHPTRESGAYALGKVLWSPRRSKGGGDIYRFMREVRPGDVVLHLTDNEAFTSVSQAASAYEDFGGVAETEWGEQPSYLVRLRDFRGLNPPLSRDVFFSLPYAERLVQLLDSGERNLFYNHEPSLNQGAYLTPAPPELVRILNEAYEELTGAPIVDTSVDARRDGSPREQHALNLVVYGPPGVGKTYSVQKRALQIIEGDSGNLPDNEIGARFRRYIAEGRVEFVTFHPSYSYEEFVEGFRYDEDAKIPVRKDGVFKVLVDRASNPRSSATPTEGARIWKVSLGSFYEQHIFERCMQEGEIAVGWLGDENLEEQGREGIAELFAKHGQGAP